MKREIEFIIEHLDPMGQGVFKKDDEVFFIPGTLPDEEGQATVLKRKKGVNFCKLKKITKESAQRVAPICSHYESCNGCHYLHTNYQVELHWKKENLKRIFKGFAPDVDITCHQATSRDSYRNRIQLQYSMKQNKIGFISLDGDIVEIPNCQLPSTEIQEVLLKLYLNNSWKKHLSADSPPSGHIEIYQREQGDISIQANGQYAHKGFRQVNDQMTPMLQTLVKKLTPSQQDVLELFGGNGNLTKNMETSSIEIVDLYPGKTPDGEENRKYHSIDLFADQALDALKKKLSSRPKIIILDPPRSGFKQLNAWLKDLQIETITYISCNPHTLRRDLNDTLSDYSFREIHLIDLFPSTFHFETLISLEKKKNK